MAIPERISRLALWLAVAVACGATAIWVHPAVAAEQKIALVIGNGAYPSSRLRNSVNDAKAMAEKLRALGFEVILRTDSNLREMTRSFSQFGQKLTPGSVSLFYYAGHGVQVQGKNFLVPIDAEIDSEAAVRTEAVDVDQLLHQLGPARLSMVILDACRNNPFERRYRAAGGGLAQIDAPTGTLLAYATAPGKVAADGAGSNGVYTDALLKTLDVPGLKVEDVFKQVRINVVKSTEGQQTPWESSSLTGEFYFRPGSKAEVENAQLQRSEKDRAELARTLEEERKKRNKEAELVSAEMEKLRAELQVIRAEAAKSATMIAAAPNATASKPVADAPAATPQQIATIAPSLNAPPPSPAAAAEWKDRIALLAKFPGELTFSKAMALLLDISADSDLSLLLAHELKIKRNSWHNAYAIGTDSKSNLVWGGGYKFLTLAYATETAVEKCAIRTGDSCRVVIENGEFRKNDLIEVAKRLGEKNIATVRQTFLQSLMKDPTEFVVGLAGNNNVVGGRSMGFSSVRQ